MPKKKKLKDMKIGEHVRILLGPRRGQTDVVKEVRRTLQNNPIYILEGDAEPRGYLTGSLFPEKRMKIVEEVLSEGECEMIATTEGGTNV